MDGRSASTRSYRKRQYKRGHRMLARASQTTQSPGTILLFNILSDKPHVFPRCHPTTPNNLDTRTHGRDRASACAASAIT